jgi:hypothetical protein
MVRRIPGLRNQVSPPSVSIKEAELVDRTRKFLSDIKNSTYAKPQEQATNFANSRELFEKFAAKDFELRKL